MKYCNTPLLVKPYHISSEAPKRIPFGGDVICNTYNYIKISFLNLGINDDENLRFGNKGRRRVVNFPNQLHAYTLDTLHTQSFYGVQSTYLIN